MRKAFMLCLVLAACGDNLGGSSSNPDGAPDADPNSTTLRATLSGFQEVPPVFADARGSATVRVNQQRTSITVELTYSDLTGITAAHIHAGTPGINGAVIFALATADFASPLTKTLTEADFMAGGGIATFADAVQAVLDGKTYINVHTSTNASGALRGHVGKATLNAIASGGQENPSVTTTATGTMTVTLNDEQTSIDVDFDATNLANANAAHIHVGEVGVNGPPIFTLAMGTVADPLDVTVTSTDLTPGGGITTMPQAVDALLSGRAYFNVHTTANAGGELRAQLGAVTLRSSLSGGQETPAVNTTAKGRSFITISGDQTTITSSTTFTNLTNPTLAHIHVGNFGASGPPIFTLAGATFTSPLDKTLVSTDLTAGGGITTFPQAVDALLAGRAYVNLHTQTRQNGEIRGQVGRVVLTSTMNGTKERPTPVVTTATGTARVTIHGDQRGLTVAGTYSMLNNITAAHIHNAAATAAGPVIFGLASATFASPYTFTVDSDDLMTATGIMNMADAIGAILDGNTYINIHTTANTGGEIRGQIEP